MALTSPLASMTGNFTTSEGRDPRWLTHDAVTAALADAGIDGRDVDALAVASAEDSAVLGCREALGHPVHSTDCEGAHGAVALHAAWTAVATGESDVVVCVGQDPPPVFGAGTIPVEALAASTRLYMRESGANEEHLALVAAKNRCHGASNPRALVEYVWYTAPSARAKAVIPGPSETYPATSVPVAPAM